MDERPAILCDAAGVGAREWGTKLWKVVVVVEKTKTQKYYTTSCELGVGWF
eukprot:GDKH01013383.1.p2 GENE.GDKH01013383.1~~GDKH01013383.1.p2  ORF type:complete len:51 (-),score=2.89 GDKH01013383.1:409-561(-)